MFQSSLKKKFPKKIYHEILYKRILLSYIIILHIKERLKFLRFFIKKIFEKFKLSLIEPCRYNRYNRYKSSANICFMSILPNKKSIY